MIGRCGIIELRIFSIFGMFRLVWVMALFFAGIDGTGISTWNQVALFIMEFRSAVRSMY